MSTFIPASNIGLRELDITFGYYGTINRYCLREASELHYPLEWTPMSEKWRKGVSGLPWGPDYKGPSPYTEEQQQLMKNLLAFGGDAVCMPKEEPDIENILRFGQLWLGVNAVFKRGEPCQCHQNACYLYDANRNRTLNNSYKQQLAIATGYALSQDGLWRQHSWCVLRTYRTCKVVETTTPRIAYFGFVMDEEQAEQFMENAC